MDHIKIIKRAWSILWSYRALWVFGVLLALTGAGGGGSSGGGGGSNAPSGNGGGNMPFNLPGELGQALRDLSQTIQSWFTPGMERQFIGIAIALLCVVVLLGILATVVQYVSRVALIRMADHYEATGEKLRWKAGWRLGWDRRAWRLFLIDLVVFLPVMLGVLVMFGCAAVPVLMSVIGNNEPSALGIITTIGMAFLAIFVTVLVALALGLFIELAYRFAVLNDAGVFDAIRQGWAALRKNFKDVFLMWLILVGISIALGIAGIIVFFLLLAIAVVLGGGIGAGLYFLVKAIGTVTSAWISAGIVGGLIALVVLGVPLTLLEGLHQTFASTVWTLTYRELNLVGAAALARLPEESPEPLIPDA